MSQKEKRILTEGSRRGHHHENKNPPPPPPPPVPAPCVHDFKVLSTDCTKQSDNYRGITYKRVDEFFCTKCLKIETKVRSECKRDFENAPDWYIRKG